MRMYVAGEWVSKPQSIPVENPYDRTVVDTVPRADRGDVERALQSAVRGARVMAKLSGYDRSRILRKAADLMVARQEDLGRTISLEEGKALAEGRLEVSRAVETMLGSAEEAKRIHGETIPVDGAPGGAGKIAFTLRVPCGVVVAITPFNFPLNLVCHKVGPALAAGNAVIVKPATDTPLSALKLTEILLEAGLPAEGIQCITGPGGELGDLLCADPRVRKITFTGSRDVGERICRVAGIKRVTMELGSNAPVIVMPDADLDKVAEARREHRVRERRPGVHLGPADPRRRAGSTATSSTPSSPAWRRSPPGASSRTRSRWDPWSARRKPCGSTSGSARR